MSWIIWLMALLLLIIAIYTFKIRFFIPLGIVCVVLTIIFIFAGIELYFEENPKNSYKCVIVEKYRSNNHCYFTVKNSEFGYNTTKSSLEKYVNTNVGDTILCKGWNEDYLEYK